MNSKSGKIVPKRNYSTFIPNADVENIEAVASKVPPVPRQSSRKSNNVIASFLEEYFGRFWWLWVVVIIIKTMQK